MPETFGPTSFRLRCHRGAIAPKTRADASPRDGGGDARDDAADGEAPHATVCPRPGFEARFEGSPVLDSSWTGLVTGGGTHAMDPDPLKHDATSGSQGLRFTLGLSTERRYAYVSHDIATGLCSITVAFSFAVSRLTSSDPHEALAYLGLELEQGTIFLVIDDGKNFLVEENLSGTTRVALPDLVPDSFARLELTYDPTASPPKSIVKLDGAEVVTMTHIHVHAAPQTLRIGATNATNGDTLTLWYDELGVK
jgi:hypothetical protein